MLTTAKNTIICFFSVTSSRTCGCTKTPWNCPALAGSGVPPPPWRGDGAGELGGRSPCPYTNGTHLYSCTRKNTEGFFFFLILLYFLQKLIGSFSLNRCFSMEMKGEKNIRASVMLQSWRSLKAQKVWGDVRFPCGLLEIQNTSKSNFYLFILMTDTVSKIFTRTVRIGKSNKTREVHTCPNTALLGFVPCHAQPSPAPLAPQPSCPRKERRNISNALLEMFRIIRNGNTSVAEFLSVEKVQKSAPTSKMLHRRESTTKRAANVW